MIRIALPFDDAYLTLAPRWGGWQSPAQAALLLLPVIVPLLLVLWLYRNEARLLPRLAAGWLLFLRLLVVLLITSVVTLQPSIAYRRTEDSPSRVLLAIDQSGSMAYRDPQRSEEEKRRLAKATKLKDKNSDVDQLTRNQIVNALLGECGLDLLARLGQKHRVEVVAFHEALLELGATWPRGMELPEPIAKSTDLGQALRHALLGETGQERHLGIILISDGRHNHGLDPTPLARELEQRGIPVYTVGIGSERPPPDIALVEVRAPANVFHEIDVPVDARLKVTGLPKGPIAVELRLRDQPARPEHQRVHQHDGVDGVVAIPFHVRLDEPGAHELSVEARPINAKVQEATLDNNRAKATVRSLRDQVHVLAIDGEARWEYHYLANALGRDAMVKAERVVFSQPRLGALSEEKLEKLGNPKTKLPEAKGSIDPLLDFDCIILGDVSAENLPLSDRARLENYVSSRGGTLVFVAGKRHVPLAFASQKNDPLYKLLPITEMRVIKPKDGFHLEPTDEGLASAFMQMAADPQVNRRTWTEFPLHYWGVAGKLKPGATMLAFARDPKEPPGKVGKLEALIARQRYGLGQVVFLGIDSTWRWRHQAGDTYHHRFWGQLVRWTAAEKLLPAGNRYVRFGSREAVYRAGQEIEIASLLRPDLDPVPSLSNPKARISRLGEPGKEEAIAVVPLRPRQGFPRLLEGKIDALPPGRYRMDLDIAELKLNIAAPADPKDASFPGAALFTVQGPENQEAKDLASDWALLRRLAQESQGRFFTVDQVDDLVQLLAREATSQESSTPIRIWQDAPAVWWLLGIVLGLLSVEWVTRKLAGLP